MQLIAQGAKNVQFHFCSTRVEALNVKNAYFTFNRCAAHGGAFVHKIAQNTYFAHFAQNRQHAKTPILRRFGEFHVLFFGEIQNFIFFYAEKADNVRRTRTENAEKTGLTNQTKCDKMNSENKKKRGETP